LVAPATVRGEVPDAGWLAETGTADDARHRATAGKSHRATGRLRGGFMECLSPDYTKVEILKLPP
jgi:hypothetical protein